MSVCPYISEGVVGHIYPALLASWAWKGGWRPLLAAAEADGDDMARGLTAILLEVDIYE
jgi:hypothetical protein